MAVLLLTAGCGKQQVPPSSAPSTATPILHQAMTAWQQGAKTEAVSRFVETDWSSRPLFSSSSPLSLTEDEFKALSPAQRQAKSAEMHRQLDSLKDLGAEVAKSGGDAALKGDTAQAQKHYTSLKQCGAALDTSNSLAIVRLVGQAFKRRADTEMSRLAP